MEDKLRDLLITARNHLQSGLDIIMDELDLDEEDYDVIDERELITEIDKFLEDNE